METPSMGITYRMLVSTPTTSHHIDGASDCCRWGRYLAGLFAIWKKPWPVVALFLLTSNPTTTSQHVVGTTGTLLKTLPPLHSSLRQPLIPSWLFNV